MAAQTPRGHLSPARPTHRAPPRSAKSPGEQHRKLKQKLTGFLAYFGVNGNLKCISAVIYWTKCAWGKWLRRRSQRARRLTWETFFGPVLKRFPLPTLGFT